MSTLITKIISMLCESLQTLETSNSEIMIQNISDKRIILDPKRTNAKCFFDSSRLALSAQFTIYVNRDYESESVKISLFFIRFTKSSSEESHGVKNKSVETEEEVNLKNYEDLFRIYLELTSREENPEGAAMQLLVKIQPRSKPGEVDDMETTQVKFMKMLQIEDNKIENTEFLLKLKIEIEEENSKTIHILTPKTKRFRFSRNMLVMIMN
ncbi:hypothetical protein CDIK_0894 [Cucumispora dikerogammari]|nr:hypothetical protein CDIK_0894 [Cucumispora dikerogammari]